MKPIKVFALWLLYSLMSTYGLHAQAPCNMQISLSYIYLGGSDYLIVSNVLNATSPAYAWQVNDSAPNTYYVRTQSSIHLTLPTGATSEVELTVTDGTCTGTDSISITAPDCTFFAYCDNRYTVSGSQDILSAPSLYGGTPPYTYQWIGGAATSTDTVSFSGAYYLLVTDSAGCQAFTGDTVTNLAACPVSASIGQYTVSGGRDSLYCHIANFASFTSSLSWSTYSNDAFIRVTNNGIYTVTINDLDGHCSVTLADTVTNLSCSISGYIVAQRVPGGSTRFMAVTAGTVHPTYVWTLPDGSTVPGLDTITLPNLASFPPLIVTITDSVTLCSYTDSIYYAGWQTAGIADVQPAAKVTIAPNPFHDRTQISIGGVDVENVMLELYDISGQRLQVITPQSEGKFEVSGSRLSPGIYIYAIRQKDTILARGKLVVQ